MNAWSWRVGAHAVLLAVIVATAPPTAAAQGAAGAPPAGGTVAVQPQGAEPARDEAKGKAIVPTQNFFEIMEKGGVLMWPIAFCSVLAVAFALERLVSLRRRRIIPRPFVRRFLEQVRQGQLDREAALALCEENRSTVAAVFAGAVRKWGRPAVEVEQAIIDAGERATNDLRRYLRIFNGVHTIAPLLGLLGTVFGMIQAFNMVAVADALGRPEMLASGISEALLTTAFGLAVAIPALILYVFFLSRVDRLIVEIDALGQEVVELISAEGLQGRPPEGRASRTRRTARAEAAVGNGEK